MHPVLLFAFDHRQSTIEFMNELEEKEYDSHLFKKNDEICSFWSVIRNEHKFTDVNSSLLDARASVHDIKTYTSTSAAWNQTSTRKIMFIPVHCNVLHTFGQLTFISHTHTHFNFGCFGRLIELSVCLQRSNLALFTLVFRFAVRR